LMERDDRKPFMVFAFIVAIFGGLLMLACGTE